MDANIIYTTQNACALFTRTDKTYIIKFTFSGCLTMSECITRV